MTDRLKGAYIAFTQDIREDDAESIIQAIKMIKGVSAVETSVSNGEDWMNREHIRSELKERFWDFYKSI